MSDFHTKSFELHKNEFKREGPERAAIYESWFAEDTIDYWRHFRMVEPLSPLLHFYPGSSWLSIGDGRYGLDSIRLKKIEPSLRVLPTDISPYLLEEAKKKGIITEFSVENAESLSFADNQFDFTSCKESYHHFPRPYLALYEMLRVASKGIILIEPNDALPRPLVEELIQRAKRLAKRILGKTILHPDHWKFEETGNYVYSVSRREIEKMAIGLQLPVVAFYYFNDHYEKGVEFEKFTLDNKLLHLIKSKIKRADFRCRMGLQSPGNIIAIVFKTLPDSALLEKLKSQGFVISFLPKNHFLESREKDQA